MHHYYNALATYTSEVHKFYVEDAFGQVLAAFEATENEAQRLQRYLDELGFNWKNESDNPSFKLFLKN